MRNFIILQIVTPMIIRHRDRFGAYVTSWRSCPMKRHESSLTHAGHVMRIRAHLKFKYKTDEVGVK